MDCEYLDATGSENAKKILGAMRAVHPGPYGPVYQGKSRVLMLWGAGHPYHARIKHSPRVMWDLGYLHRDRYYRVAIGRWHPTPEQIENTPPDPFRWDHLGIKLREDANPGGHVLVIGMGVKSVRFTGDAGWERRTLARYPGATLRPKKGNTATIEQALKGASLVVCRHSNVAVDACIAGVPFLCEDGAASWLLGKPYTPENRLDFLRRLAWWQYRPDEAREAWNFIEARV